MKIWTYGEARDKLLGDLDMEEEEFVGPNELIGYFNEGIEEAESEILKIDEDYFLAKKPFPLVEGVSSYAYPVDIYGMKVRGFVYANGATIYDIMRFQRRGKFQDIALAAQYSGTDDYRWFPSNDSVDGARMNLVPPARETAASLTSSVASLWYIRHAKRVPLLGEYVLEWDVVAQASAVSAATNTITTAKTYAANDQIKLSSTDTMPGGLVAGTVYYALVVTGGIQLSLTSGGAAIDITSTGSGALSISVAATQSIVDNTPIDIPEFTKFVIQWAKCRCLDKDKDPSLAGAVEALTQQRAQMVSTLTDAQADDQTQMAADLSAYSDMS